MLCVTLNTPCDSVVVDALEFESVILLFDTRAKSFRIQRTMWGSFLENLVDILPFTWTH